MSSYTLNGDDVLFGAFLPGIKKTFKAASKTIARFDPTAKNAKYGNITKGILAGTALAGAALLTGGGALAVGTGLVSAGETGIKIGGTPVRKPPKGITPDALQLVQNLSAPLTGGMPLNSFTDMNTALTARPADSAIASQYATSNKQSKLPITVIGLSVAGLAVAVLLLSKKKSSLQGV